MNTVKLTTLICALLSLIAYGYINHLHRNPHYGKVFYKLGIQCQNECSPKKRHRYFQKAAYHDPNLIDANYQLGIIYGEKGDYEKEIEYYKKITQLDHMHHNAYFRVALHYFQKGEMEYAERYLMQAGQGRHDIDEISYYTAKVYDSKGMYEEAVDLYIYNMVRRTVYSAEVCERIWEISKIPGQFNVVMKHINNLLGVGAIKQEKLWQQV